MAVSYDASRNVRPLDSFFKTQVRPTSKEAYHSLEHKDTQIALFLEAYRSHPEGFTDEELKYHLLETYGLRLPNSTVSARRNDINPPGRHIIVNLQGETRKNRTGVRALVWKLNQYVREE